MNHSLSAASASGTSPYAGRDVSMLLASRAKQFAERIFLIWEPFVGAARKWTYREFDHEVTCLAAGLQKSGVPIGGAVLIHLDNCPEAMLIWHACARIGAIAVTTNTRSTIDELSYFADHSAPVAAVTQPKYAAIVRQACKHIGLFVVTDTDGDAIEPHGNLPDQADRWARLSSTDPTHFERVTPDPWRRLSVQYTSGTTSRPKGVVWTHANALWGAQVSAQHEGLTDRDVHFVHLPMFHTNAMVYSALATLWAGGTMVLAPRFSASRFWEVSTRHHSTWSSMIPFCVNALLEQPVPAVHSYRIWAPAVAIPPAEQHFRVHTMGWWGMTETVTHGILGSLYESEPYRSIGRAAPEYTISVINEAGAPCRIGETGDLFVGGVRGLSLFAEYLNDDGATSAAFREDGLMITGDRITLGEQGLLYFADRAKDMLKVGGENVAASEIEAIISSVAGVREVAVVGKPDKMLDEVPVAFVILDQTQNEKNVIDEINRTCALKLADFKRVREVIFVTDLPRATLDKVAKAELKKRLGT